MSIVDHEKIFRNILFFTVNLLFVKENKRKIYKLRLVCFECWNLLASLVREIVAMMSSRSYENLLFKRGSEYLLPEPEVHLISAKKIEKTFEFLTDNMRSVSQYGSLRMYVPMTLNVMHCGSISMTLHDLDRCEIKCKRNTNYNINLIKNILRLLCNSVLSCIFILYMRMHSNVRIN